MISSFWGWFFLIIGTILTIVDFVLGWLQFDLFGVPLPIGLLIAVYGGLVVIYYKRRRTSLELTPEDMALHGRRLEEAVPMILDLYDRKVAIPEIATIVEQQHSVPQEITGKYILSYLKALQEQEADEELSEPGETPIEDETS